MNINHNILEKIKNYTNKIKNNITTRTITINTKDETGSATAEYAIIALCAVAFAGTLLTVIKGAGVQEMLLSIITKALQIV